LDGLERHWKNEGCSLQVVINPELPQSLNRVREIIALFTDPAQRNKGYASALIKEVCAEADKQAIVLLLKAEKYGKTGGIEELIPFYNKFGFVHIQENPDLMARAPQVKLGKVIKRRETLSVRREQRR
jgi:GNAT superfamily N-acetyltransferase